MEGEDFAAKHTRGIRTLMKDGYLNIGGPSRNRIYFNISLVKAVFDGAINTYRVVIKGKNKKSNKINFLFLVKRSNISYTMTQEIAEGNGQGVLEI